MGTTVVILSPLSTTMVHGDDDDDGVVAADAASRVAGGSMQSVRVAILSSLYALLTIANKDAFIMRNAMTLKSSNIICVARSRHAIGFNGGSVSSTLCSSGATRSSL